jgi:UDP-N-acetylglucosamine 2-epimerase (non-hydrolysing)
MSARIVSVVGARPNFMKIAPLEREFVKHENVEHMTVHTGQHYDKQMSDVFFDQLGLASPVRHLGVGSGGHGEMTGKVMIAFEKACLELRPDLVIVVGDVNSTLAASLVARKLGVKVAHVESGLRSFDETMPEEHNRKLTDHLSNLLFVSEPSGVENLRREGIDMNRVYPVGDIMLETLQMCLGAISSRERWEDFNLQKGAYALITIHRPSNVDHPDALREVMDMLGLLPYPTIFPVHPRTRSRLEAFELKGKLESLSQVRLVPPEAYLDFLSLLAGSKLVLSDSGSIQAEASFFDVPCLVCRENTERPIYVEQGTSTVVGRDKDKIRELVQQIQNTCYKKSTAVVKSLGRDVALNIAKVVLDSFRKQNVRRIRRHHV